MKIQLKVQSKVFLADYFTPTAIYEKLRKDHPNSLLLESSDYHTKENHFSYICINPIAKFLVEKNQIVTQYPDTSEERIKLKDKKQVLTTLKKFFASFQAEKLSYPFITGGFFGYSTYDAVRYFEDIKITKKKETIPEIFYQLFQVVIVFEHFQGKLYLFEYHHKKQKSNLLDIWNKIQAKQVSASFFKIQGEEKSNYKDEEFLKIIKKGIWHCHRGDVFQVVLSRKFFQKFQGDDWNVYRLLRSINPSPYLFYFSYKDFKIFGSSPEAQIVIKNKEVSIYPIAGTYPRTGNDAKDYKLAKELAENEKENAEHCMLVDLARNDLSKQSNQVRVETFKELQYYSHVIHMVSKVVGKIKNKNSTQFFADTFPAGTLSGAPKYKAMKIIDELEESNREFYGGAIGFFGFNGEVNHAITIRSILSYKNCLYYQAGGGIVFLSNKKRELQEVQNKSGALRTAILQAHKNFALLKKKK